MPHSLGIQNFTDDDKIDYGMHNANQNLWRGHVESDR